MEFKILTSELLEKCREALTESPQEKLDNIKKFDMPVDYFQFYKSVSSVYSSRIEGEDIEFDSFFKHKFMGVEFCAEKLFITPPINRLCKKNAVILTINLYLSTSNI